MTKRYIQRKVIYIEGDENTTDDMIFRVKIGTGNRKIRLSLERGFIYLTIL